MTTPTPRQVGHGRDVITWPSNERCTVCTSPRPPQVSHGTGAESPLVPLPWHRAHNTAVSTVTCLVTPVGHSSKSRRIRNNESDPTRTRPLGPGAAPPGVHPPPKTASTTPPKPLRPPNPPAPDAAAFWSGSPPK